VEGLRAEVVEQGLMLSHLLRAVARLRTAIEAALQEAGSPLTPVAVEVLRTLAVRGRATRAALGRLHGVRTQSLERTLEACEARGLVESLRVPGRRAVDCRLTAAGLRALGEALTVMDQAERRLFKGVPRADRDHVLAVVRFGAETVDWEARQSWHPLRALDRR
jgi:DNA-binding MarR family transcriptional regulator